MRIRFNEEVGTITIDGVVISANVLREIVNPDRRVLFRFQRRAGKLTATVYTEKQLIWIDRPDDIDDQTAEIGMVAENGAQGGEQG